MLGTLTILFGNKVTVNLSKGGITVYLVGLILGLGHGQKKCYCKNTICLSNM